MQCTFYDCPSEYDDAKDQLNSIIEDYGQAGKEFACYHDDNHETVVIKTVNLSAVIHSWIWPSIGFIFGLVIALLAYYEKIGQPPPHEEDEEECDKETIIQELNGNNEERGVVNKVRVIDEDESEAEADAAAVTKTTTDEDKIQLTGVPSKSEHNA